MPASAAGRYPTVQCHDTITEPDQTICWLQTGAAGGAALRAVCQGARGPPHRHGHPRRARGQNGMHECRVASRISGMWCLSNAGSACWNRLHAVLGTSATCSMSVICGARVSAEIHGHSTGSSAGGCTAAFSAHGRHRQGWPRRRVRLASRLCCIHQIVWLSRSTRKLTMLPSEVSIVVAQRCKRLFLTACFLSCTQG